MILGVIMSMLFPYLKYHVCYILLERQEVNKGSKIASSVFYLKRPL